MIKITGNNKLLCVCKTLKNALKFYEKPLSSFHPEYNIAQHHEKAAEALVKIRRLKYEYI